MGSGHLFYQLTDVIGNIVWKTILVLGFSFFGIGQEIHNQIGCLVDVALDHLPAINQLVRVILVNTEIHQITPPLETGQNIFYPMGHTGNGLADGAQTF